ncbi:nose resistant to fluoxetine protein 6-like [Anticarsia gemmatalis]|uniref:nose resistant to fluoxetine protein 6-like n=1 Tax=Anticarsia gemmatalis TaxID=129554 RepID=UPI003F757BF1
MPSPRALTALALLALAALAAAAEQPLFDLTDEQYYSMPVLFELDEWAGCGAGGGAGGAGGAGGGAYCVGSFELLPEHTHDTQLYDMMRRYSANWVDNFNHTRLHRGVCLPRSCARHAPAQRQGELMPPYVLQDWFSTCVNATTTAAYNLSARLFKLDYCRVADADSEPLTISQRVFAGFVAAMLALAAVSTVLEVTLPDHAKKGAEWALSWSLQGSWRVLHAAPPSASRTDLRSFDGLRVLTMAVVIVEHVTWITTHTYLSDVRTYEKIRRSVDVVLLANSTLVVQIFFTMSSFLLAHKLLQQRRKGDNTPPVATFLETMINRIIRISPSYFVTVWFAASWYERLGSGPMWTPLVGAEAQVCRRKWWTHLLYLNNVLYADDKCLIQTWYLAADTQLYALCLILTLTLMRWRRAAIAVLVALLAGSMGLLFALAYQWRLVPTLMMHRPESVRVSYEGEPTFNVLYQSPLGNVPGALAGLLLAHIHHTLLDNDVQLHRYKVFSWISVLSVPAATWWVAGSPLLLGRGPPDRLAGAALAVIERPVFAFFVGMALLGAMNGVESAVRRVLAWSGWACWARLSFGALLLHMPINKALVAARLSPSQLDRPSAITEWFGVAAVSYLAALPLALLVEIPVQRLHRALTRSPRAAPRHPATEPKRTSEKADL